MQKQKVIFLIASDDRIEIEFKYPVTYIVAAFGKILHAR